VSDISRLPARLIDLGVRDYADVWAMQLALVKERQRDEIPDTLLLVEHPHVITAGRSAKRDNLIDLGDTPLYEIERGGDVTYHGPGQLVGYPIFLLRDAERDLHVYLRNLEELLIRALARFDLVGTRKQGWTGVWNAAAERKLASIGIAVKRWVTMHGFALNVATDLRRFAAINPCGLDAAVMGSMSGELGRTVDIAAVKAAVRDTFADVFQRRFS
jgi:lipoate-protein ligase B